MTSYQDGELVSVLPEFIGKSADAKAISYAFKMGMQKAIRNSIKTSLYANIDKLDDELLDLMALEFRTQYYEEALDIEKKRQLIKHSLAWHTKAGTPSAVQELIQTIFGKSEIVEWFNYTEEPYTPNTFEIQVNERVTEELIAYFVSIIHRVKNARSHIRRILTQRTIDMKAFVGALMYSKPDKNIYNHREIILRRFIEELGYVGVGLVTMPEVNITSISNNKIYDNANTALVGSLMYSLRDVIIGNSKGKNHYDIVVKQDIGVFMEASMEVTILKSI